MKYISTAQKKREEVDTLFKAAYESLQRANIIMGSSRVASFSLATPTENSVDISERSIMGVCIPVVKYKKSEELHPNYGILNTDNSLDEAFCAFSKIKEKLLELSEIEVTVYKLANAVKKVSKRANSLKNIQIPKFEEQIKYISNVLDEKEREEFSRLKILKEE